MSMSFKAEHDLGKAKGDAKDCNGMPEAALNDQGDRIDRGTHRESEFGYFAMSNA